ncbi:MAG: hypothetical protein JWO59_56 [Chloroflexi bacterium]|nr:hypothetical protein [Chloroflexota bacterium]
MPYDQVIECFDAYEFAGFDRSENGTSCSRTNLRKNAMHGLT